MTKLRAGLLDNNGRCESCNVDDPHQIAVPVLMGGFGYRGEGAWGTMWMCGACIQKSGRKPPRYYRPQDWKRIPMSAQAKRYMQLCELLKNETDPSKQCLLIAEADAIWVKLSEFEQQEIDGLLTAIDEVERTGRGYPPSEDVG